MRADLVTLINGMVKKLVFVTVWH